MSLRDLFTIPEQLSPNQTRWLALCAAVPDVKAACNSEVNPADIALADEAQSLLNNRMPTRPGEGDDYKQNTI